MLNAIVFQSLNELTYSSTINRQRGQGYILFYIGHWASTTKQDKTDLFSFETGFLIKLPLKAEYFCLYMYYFFGVKKNNVKGLSAKLP